MQIPDRQSLLTQLLGGYLLFMAVLLGGGIGLSVIIERQLVAGARAADLALAKTIALETASTMDLAQRSVGALGQQDGLRQGGPAAERAMAAFRAARPEMDRVYWLDAQGVMRYSSPSDPRTLGTDYSGERVFRRAAQASGPFVEPGVVDLSTYNGVVIIAQPVRDARGDLLGVVAANVLLDDLSSPLRTVVADQSGRGQPLLISVVDGRGQLIATAERERILQPMLGELPGAGAALAGQESAQLADVRGSLWLYSAVPVPGLGWAVVVQRPASVALAAVASVRSWLIAALAMTALGGLLLWLALVRRVIRPLQQLAGRYAALGELPAAPPPAAAARADEVGALARTLHRLEGDVAARLAQLRTLLDTSSEVVRTLDPGVVASTIIREVQRLVDVQATAVLVPGDDGALKVLASAGRAESYDRSIHIAPDTPDSPSALALRSGAPTQMIAGSGEPFPAASYAAGFRALLAIPIVSQHVGSVVLLVSRTRPEPFSQHDLGLLLTFANYATLAWEHAVLYERSDERLREVARENERLYREALAANQFKSTLLAAVGHELRTPLAAIKGHASSLLEDDVVWGPEDQQHFLRTISSEADKLAALVSNLLDLSRLEAGLLLLRPRAWDVGALLDGALAALHQPIPRLVRRIPPGLPPVAVERPRIEVVLRNLLANGLAYGEGGIWLSAERAGDTVRIQVRDDGPGIAAEDLPHIFERFYRAERGVQRRATGTGLGLAICKAFVEAHGGRIWAESDGAGTTFCLTLPIAKEREEEESDAAENNLAGRG
ncbi:GAF domain-containing protein [Chloroflexia bacterium SDU3-3]|nr:GAF domain-containing protein [Chloroflexia bacterium SDU3-3]